MFRFRAATILFRRQLMRFSSSKHRDRVESLFTNDLFKTATSRRDFFDEYISKLKGLEPSVDILKLLSSSPVVTDIGHGVKAINFDKQKFDAAFKPFGYGTMSHTVYERSFYPELLAQIHTCENVALIGSAGTSKSTFQYWLLYAYLQGTAVTNYRADGTNYYFLQ